MVPDQHEANRPRPIQELLTARAMDRRLSGMSEAEADRYDVTERFIADIAQALPQEGGQRLLQILTNAHRDEEESLTRIDPLEIEGLPKTINVWGVEAQFDTASVDAIGVVDEISVEIGLFASGQTATGLSIEIHVPRDHQTHLTPTIAISPIAALGDALLGFEVEEPIFESWGDDDHLPAEELAEALAPIARALHAV